MQRSLTLAVALSLSISMVTSAMAQNAAADAKKACENFNALGATGDAAKLVREFYTSNAMFIGPAPVAGILIGHEAIQKNYEGISKPSRRFPPLAKMLRCSATRPLRSAATG